MNLKQIIAITAVPLVFLSGCNSGTDGSNKVQSSIQSGVFQGVIFNDSNTPYAAKVTIQESSKALLTLWDDREHQVSYVGIINGDKVTFSDASVMCQVSGNSYSCEANNRRTNLSIVTDSGVKLTDFSGVYQAGYNNTLYQMDIDSSGHLVLTNGECESEGHIRLSTQLEGVANLSLNDSDCFNSGYIGLVETVRVNDSLFTLNIQSDSPDFPQEWVMQ